MEEVAKLYPVADFMEPIDITKAVKSNPQLETYINNQIKSYRNIDINVVFENLSHVGNVIKLAYADSKGFSCSTQIMDILINFQGFIKESHVICESSLESSMTALRCLKVTVNVAEKNDLKKALNMWNRCSNIAGGMADNSAKLESIAIELVEKATAALVAASKDESISTSERKKIVDSIGQFKSRQAGLKSKTESLSSRIENLNKDQDEIAKKIDKEYLRDRLTRFGNGVKDFMEVVGPIVGLIQVISMPFGGINPALLIPFGGAVLSITITLILKLTDINNKNKNTKEFNLNKQEMLHALQSKEAAILAKISELRKEEESLGKKNSQSDEIKKKKEENKDNIENAEEELSDVRDEIEKTQDYCSKMIVSLESLKRQKKEISDLKEELQREEKAANSELVSIAEKLKNLKPEKKDLEAAILSLEMTIKCLGIIKTTFENTKAFWNYVKSKCDSLKNIDEFKMYADYDMKEEFLTEIKTAGLNWLALGQINYIASESIKKTDKKVDEITKNLPTKLEALEIVKKNAKEILNSFA